MGKDTGRGAGSVRRQRLADELGQPTACYTCRGCGFILVVSSVAAVRALGWHGLDEDEGTGLCANCPADHQAGPAGGPGDATLTES